MIFEFLDIYNLLPLILFFFALYFLGVPRKRHMRIFHKGTETKGSSTEGEKTIYGNYDYSKPNWKVEPTNIWNAVGDHTMDFTKAFIPDQDTSITIHGVADDIN